MIFNLPINILLITNMQEQVKQNEHHEGIKADFQIQMKIFTVQNISRLTIDSCAYRID
jgi:hypothetical protein